MTTSGTAARRAAQALAVAMVAVTAGIGSVTAAPAAQAGKGGCEKGPDPGPSQGTQIPWAQQRLDFDRVHRFATGAGQRVAVIDSGFGYGPATHPQVRQIRTAAPRTTIAGYAPGDVIDCHQTGHGTGVASIIAAPPMAGIGFQGLAPEATIIPIRQIDPDDENANSGPGGVAAGIAHAVSQGAGVVNVSLDFDLPANHPEVGVLRAAMRQALDKDVVVVVAAGNADPQRGAERWPASLGDEFPNMLTVGATDEADQVIPETVGGPHVNISAPGSRIEHPTRITGYYENPGGTSYAAPFVSATAAMVRERFPRLSAAQVVKRIEATADRPGATVPHDGYGCGIVNPYRALTQVLDGSPADVRRAPPCSYAADRTDKKSYITPPNPPEPPDRTLQNIAYGVAAGLLGAAALFAIGTGAWRRTQAAHRELRQAADQ